MIAISVELRKQIEVAGERDYPNETCGFILGHAGDMRVATSILQVDNAREPGETYHRFEIAPKDFFDAERTAAVGGLDVIGIYHSHPDHPAAPSEYDLEHGLPYYSYVIVSVNGGQAEKLTSWRLENDRSRFTEENILAEEG